MMETRPQPLAFEKRLWQADRGNFSTLLPRIGEISLVIWKLPFSEITGYIKARAVVGINDYHVYYPTLIARICGWMSADLFNHIIHVSFTACLHFSFFSTLFTHAGFVKLTVLETESSPYIVRYTLYQE